MSNEHGEKTLIQEEMGQLVGKCSLGLKKNLLGVRPERRLIVVEKVSGRDRLWEILTWLWHWMTLSESQGSWSYGGFRLSESYQVLSVEEFRISKLGVFWTMMHWSLKLITCNGMQTDIASHPLCLPSITVVIGSEMSGGDVYVIFLKEIWVNILILGNWNSAWRRIEMREPARALSSTVVSVPSPCATVPFQSIRREAVTNTLTSLNLFFNPYLKLVFLG